MAIFNSILTFRLPIDESRGVKEALGALQPGRPVLMRLQRQEPLVQQIKGVAD